MRKAEDKIGRKKKSEGERKQNGILGPILTFMGTIIVAILALVGVEHTNITNLKLQKNEQDYEIFRMNMENDYVQHFFVEAEEVQRVGIDYIQYSVTSDPALKGYHIYILPYTESTEIDGSRRYTAAESLFVQEEYAADSSGTCRMLLEETEDEKVKYLLVIKYVEDEEEKIESYCLNDGQLVWADEAILISLTDQIF